VNSCQKPYTQRYKFSDFLLCVEQVYGKNNILYFDLLSIFGSRRLNLSQKLSLRNLKRRPNQWSSDIEYQT